MNVSSLTTFYEESGWTYSALEASDGGALDVGDLASLETTNLDIAGPDEGLTLATVTTFSYANITVSGGATLSLPGVTSFTANGGNDILEATGTGSVLTLANLTTVTQAYNDYGAEVQFEAVLAGTVTLPSLQTIETGTVVLDSADAGSVLNVSSLTTFYEESGWTYSALEASDGGALDVGDLASLETTNLDIAGPDEGLTLATVTTFSYANITVSGGATLSLPGVTSFTANGGNDILEATGTGSVLTLANLTTVTQAYNDYGAEVQFEAVSAGIVTLTSLQTIETGTVVLDSAGTGSVLNVSSLTTFYEENGWNYSALEASDGGALEVGDLASLETTNIDIAGPDEDLTLATVTTFSYANITISAGATLSLPGVTAFTANGGNDILEATGTGSVLTLANLMTVTQANNDYGAEVQFEAVSGGTVTLTSLQTIETGTVVLDSAGAGSVLNVSSLTTFYEENGWNYSALEASDGGGAGGGRPGQPGVNQHRHRRPGRGSHARHRDHVQLRQHHHQRRGDPEPARRHRLHGQRR